MSAVAASPAADAHRPSERVLTVRNLRAYYQTHYFGVNREVRAVDGITLHVDRNEIYGLAGESSCGKTTLIKTIVRAIRPPLKVVGGSVSVPFRWPRPRHLCAEPERARAPSAGGISPTSCRAR